MNAVNSVNETKETAILFLGDIIGNPGRRAVRALVPDLLERYQPDIVIANGENAAGGFGITPDITRELWDLGVDVITSGNHIWDKKEIIEFIDSAPRLIRPENYPDTAPGSGSVVFRCRSGAKVAVLNLCGRIFMNNIDCPFKAGMKAVERLKKETPLVFVDFHAEATSEKNAIGYYLDGHVTVVAGSHTHVQTSDERILPKGTAYITDAGMTGPVNSIIGIEKDLVIGKFLSQMPVRYEVAKKGVELQGVFIKADTNSGRALSVERVKVPLNGKG